MSESRFRSTATILFVTQPGTAKSANGPAVAPKTEEVPAGTYFRKSDFDSEVFREYVRDGILVESNDLEQQRPREYQRPAAAPAPEDEATKRERLFNEAKLLGVKGLAQNTKTDVLEAKVLEARNKRDADGTTPSGGAGTGRADPAGGARAEDANAEDARTLE